MSFLLAHLSDAHIGPIPRPNLVQLLGKRATGYANWLHKRAAQHDMGILTRLVADLRAQKADHVAMTGDIVNIGLPAEFEAARAWLKTIGAPEDVSFTPGNHDAYVTGVMPLINDTFAPWTSDDDGAASFPYLRRRGGVALIGLSSGVPTAPFVATGKLGETQRERLAVLLDETRAQGLARVVLLHHPPHVGGARAMRGLDDARAFEEIIARHGAELVLHGHNHTGSVHWLDGRGLNGRARPTPIVGVASASAKAGAHKPSAAYHLFTVERRDDSVAVSGRVRGLREDGEAFGDLGAIELRA